MDGYDQRIPESSGGAVRTFFIVILFFLAFLLFASGVIGNANLTSNTPGSGQVPVQAAAPVTTGPVVNEPQVITIQESPTPNDNTIPVTGECTNPYIVRFGDVLSQIAAVCDTSVAAIRQVNPQITDANLIYPGQQLVIPNVAVPPPAVQPTTVAVPVTGEPIAKMPVPVTGLYSMVQAGTGLQVKGIGYPANTPVNIAIGPQNTSYTVVTSGITDTNGNLTTRIVVPSAPDSQTPWVVVVSTTTQPPIQAMSQPFVIGP